MVKFNYFFIIILVILLFINSNISFSNDYYSEECLPIWNFGEIVGFRFDITFNTTSFSPKVYECIRHYKDISNISSLSVGFKIHSMNNSFLLKRVILGDSVNNYKTFNYKIIINSNDDLLLVYKIDSSFFSEEKKFNYTFYLKNI